MLGSSIHRLFMACLCLLLVFSFSSAEVIEYNDWAVPSGDATSLPDETAKVGDIVQFNWIFGRIHNVYIHPNNNCDLEDRRLVGLETGARYEFTQEDADKGSVFFSCDAFDHCNFGLHVTFFVEGGGGGGTEGPKDAATSTTYHASIAVMMAMVMLSVVVTWL